jgi:transposase InsO family protein
MSLARVVVTAVVVEGRSKSEVARDYHLSRRWVQTLVARYLAEGEAGLQPRSRRPHRCPCQIGGELEEEIICWRKQLSEQGLDAGADTIATHLRQRHGQAPAVSTIWRVLTRRGFVTPQPRKRPKSSFVRFQADQPNECWQTDFTHYQLADGTGVEILNFLDDHSRYLLGCTVFAVVTGPDVTATFAALTARHGLPASVLSDNGAVFTGRSRGGRNGFDTQLAALGVQQKNCRPYHPQTCGKIERFHQTLKRWLAKQPQAATLAELQTQLDTFADYYNTRRPHRAIGRRTPAQAYTARPKATPGKSILGADYRLRHDRIDRHGKLTLRHAGQLHHIGIGRRHAGTPVMILVKDLNIRIIGTDGHLLGQLLLDPSRDYQPQAARKPSAPSPLITG